MHNFVEGIKIIEKLLNYPMINHLIDDQVAVMCLNFPMKPPSCKDCDKFIPNEKKQELMKCGFSIVEHKCYMVYDFNKNKSN